jgi:hypothetical protein
MDLNEKQMRNLEGLVDLCGIDSVLMALSEICGAKSEHINHNWQDYSLAKRWATLEGAIGVTVSKAVGL